MTTAPAIDPVLEIQHRRRAALIAAAAVGAFLPLDLLMGIHTVPVARAAWVASLIIFAFVRPRRDHLESYLIGVISGVEVAYIGWLVGPYFLAYLYALPFAAMVLFRHKVAPVLFVGVTSLLVGGWMTIARGEPPLTTVGFVFCAGASAVFATWGSRAFRQYETVERASLEGQRQAREALAESERLRARSARMALVGQLASGVAHEINNPLSYAKSSLDWVRNNLVAGGEAPNLDELREALAEAVHGVLRIQQVVADLSAFARTSDGGPGGCDVGEAVREAVRLASLRIGDGAEVVLDVGAGLWSPTIQQGRLVQVLLNLLLNAADAVQTTGRRGRIEVRGVRRDGRITLQVEDDGPGLEAGVAAHLFEPFFTTKGNKGTGLGLTLSREYLERAGGTIEAGQGRLGGALFSVELPGGEAPAPPSGAR